MQNKNVNTKNGDEIILCWEKISAREGTDVTKNLIYGDALYEEIF